MITILLILAILVWPFGQLLSFSLPGFSFTIYLLDVIVGLLFLSLFISPRRKEIFRTPLTKPLCVFLGIVILSLLVNFRLVVSSSPLPTLLYALRLFIYPSLYFAVKHVGFPRIKKYLYTSLLIFIIFGLIQYLFFPDMRFLKYLGFDDHYFRLIGTFYDPNFTGAVLSGLALLFLAQKRYIPSLLLVIMLALTFSRASYLSFLVGLIYLLFKEKHYKILILIPLLTTVVYLIPKPFGEGVNLARTFSIFSRLESWQQGLDLFISKPLLGWGYNTLRSADGSRFQIDNSYLFIMATTGLAGLLAFGNVLLKGFRRVPLPVQGLFLSLSVHAIFNNTLLYIWIYSLIWLFFSSESKECK